jgi:predicted secreted Zn-dependent protease
MAPKSILKQTASDLTAKPAAKTREERHREIALYHANLIQSQKDVEAAITAAIETLIDFPSSASSTSAVPAPEDVDEFTKLVYVFTPSDYDDLIEERRIDNKCGYVFCSNAPQTTQGGRLKILGGSSANAKIVARSKSEAWCSKACAKRALFVKVQLMEEPAWSRRAGSAPELEILTEDLERQMASKEQGRINVEAEDMEGKMRELALERGDGEKPARSTGMISDVVVERDAVEVPTAPLHDRGGKGDAIEGYVPLGKAKKDLMGVTDDLGERELNI